MAKITLGGTPIETSGSLPNLETILSNFELAANDLSTKTLEDYKGFRKILNIFPSVDTGVCAASSRKFNEEASLIPSETISGEFIHLCYCGIMLHAQ